MQIYKFYFFINDIAEEESHIQYSSNEEYRIWDMYSQQLLNDHTRK